MWVVVKIMVPFGVLRIVRHLYLRDPKRDHNFDNHPIFQLFEDYFKSRILLSAPMPRVPEA